MMWENLDKSHPDSAHYSVMRKAGEYSGMETTPDFEALRARRNAAVQEMHQKMADECGVPLQSLRSNFKPTACYCACGTGGPCEHKWDGPDWESEDGCACSVTCSLCGCTAMSHDMRNAP